MTGELTPHEIQRTQSDLADAIATAAEQAEITNSRMQGHINYLTSELEGRDQTIADLKDRIEELEADITDLKTS